MGTDKDFSVFIKSGHVLYCFFRCCLIPFEGIPEKNGKIKLTEKLAILQYLVDFSFNQCQEVASKINIPIE